MLARLRKLFRARTAVEAGLENPVLKAVVLESAKAYQRIPLCDFIDEEARQDLSRTLFLDINRVCNAADPVMACRDRLASAMLEFASYQVLVIPPPPAEDESGLRGQPGISGELGEHLASIIYRNDNVRSAVAELTTSEEIDDLWQVVWRLYWTSRWFLETFDAARIALNDVETGDDWYRSFMHAACASKEHQYRWEIELPPAFREDVAQRASTAYSIFTDIVLSGEQNPAAEWRNYHKDSNIPVPSAELQRPPNPAH